MIFEKVRGIVSEQMNIPEDKITLETSFADDLGADSLDVFQIAADLEDAFDLEFSDESIKKVKTVGNAVEYIKIALEE